MVKVSKMSDARRCSPRRTKPKVDTNLMLYVSFFGSPNPSLGSSVGSWEESQLQDIEKTGYDNTGYQAPEVVWDRSGTGRNMDDPIVVVDDDKSPSFAPLRAQFGRATSEHGEPKQAEPGRNRFFTDNNARSPSSTILSSNQNPSASVPNGKATKMEDGIKQPCVICGGIANGYHFGALSCAACNAFFRRSVAESRKYFCRKSGHCVVDQTARCFCRACRLKKCLESGMDPNAVQPHRDMIGQKPRKRSRDEHRNDSENSGYGVDASSVSGLNFDEKKATPESELKDLSGKADKEDCRKSDTVVLSTGTGILCKTADLPSAFTTCSSVVPKKAKYAESATAQLLTSTNIIAEQLIAFSRTPLIGTFPGDTPPANRLCEPDNPQAARNRIEVAQAVSAMKFEDPTTLCADGKKGFGASLLASQLSQFVDKAKAYTPEQFAPCSGMFQQPASSTETANQVNEAPSSSSQDWLLYDAEPSARPWASSPPLLKIRNPSTPGAEYDSSTNVIELLVDAYRRLRERRRLLYCPGTLRDLLSGTEPPLRAVPLGDSLNDKCRLDAGLICEFFNCIHPFSKLRLDDRILLFKNASVPYSLMEKHYMTMRGGGFQANRIINMDNTYLDLTLVEEEGTETQSDRPADDGTMVSTDRSTVRRLLVPQLRDSLKDITGPMYHSGMTDVEFVALTVTILLDHTAPSLSEVARRLVKEARDRMYLDWFSYYEAHGVADGAQRVGNALLLLPAIYVTCKKQSENYHLARFFNFFEMASLIDEIME